MQLDKKGIIYFLLITYGMTYPVLYLLWQKGFWLGDKHPFYSNMALALTLFMPAISAYIVREYMTTEKKPGAGMVMGPWKPYLHVYILIPILFAVVYGLTWVFIDAPNWSRVSFTSIVDKKIYNVSAGQFILTSLITSFATAPVVSGLHAFGQEYGWRGYLLPKLLPLGRKKALVVSSVIWALWYAPFVALGLHYSENLWAGAATFFIFTVLLGIYIGYLRLISGSIILASFAHGVFIAQFYGAWSMLFPGLNKVSGGITGVPGVLVFMVLAIWILSKKIEVLPDK